MSADTELLTVDEVAEQLRVTRVTVYKYIGSGELASFKMGANRRISRSALAAFIQSQQAASEAAS